MSETTESTDDRSLCAEEPEPIKQRVVNFEELERNDGVKVEVKSTFLNLLYVEKPYRRFLSTPGTETSPNQGLRVLLRLIFSASVHFEKIMLHSCSKI